MILAQKLNNHILSIYDKLGLLTQMKQVILTSYNTNYD